MTEWTEDALLNAWRALIQPESNERWRVVQFARFGDVSIEVGCHFPMRREALIVSFRKSSAVSAVRFPEGKGFDVIEVNERTGMTGNRSIALVRKTEGPSDMFTAMAIDVLRYVEINNSATGINVIERFLQRVKEWQSFMSNPPSPLSTQAQVGLFGELWMLRLLVKTNLGPNALKAWQGPLRAAQDFHIWDGAIEVKSTVQSDVFLARINSIEQLGDERQPMFLCAFRFEENSEGMTLADLVGELQNWFLVAGLHRTFEALLLMMGYLQQHEQFYSRPLLLRDSNIFHVRGDMPRLTRATLPEAITSASYILNLTELNVAPEKIDNMFAELGLR